MFRPYSNGAHTVQEAIAKLSDAMRGLPSDSLKAQQLARTIRRLEALTDRGQSV